SLATILPALFVSVFACNCTSSNSTLTSNSTRPLVVICPRDWFSGQRCVLSKEKNSPKVNITDEYQCTLAHSSLYFCLTSFNSSMTYRHAFDDEDLMLIDSIDDYY
ncbi:hypothetical protein PFISCL1PPCAC_17104, partial [Pristionchus fissidentatus]